MVRETRDEPVPMHLRNAPTRLMKGMGYGKGYEYPHDAPGHFKLSENLPETVSGMVGSMSRVSWGRRRQIGERLRYWWGERYGE